LLPTFIEIEFLLGNRVEYDYENNSGAP
jgi:hypothetical protein